jgi:NADPH:quinone reductase and related Zn-dependent oxidoreductases
MNAAQINSYGTDAIQINPNAQKPELIPDSVLIEIRAAGVNPFDWKLRAGHMVKAIPLTFPATMGGDFSGIILEVGSEVRGFAIGDEVYGQAHILAGGTGSFAEIARAKTTTIAPKPTHLTHEFVVGVIVAKVYLFNNAT